jgi:ketosteroid isomerase-like protein
VTVDDETRAAVLAANEAFYRAFAGKDFAAMDALWARDAPVACIHPLGELLTSRDDIMATWLGILHNPDQPRVVGASEQVTLVGDLGFVVGREFVAGSAIVATNIFVREEGVWRMAHHHSSPMVMLTQ